MQKYLTLLLILLIVSCKDNPEKLKIGNYRATLKVNDTLNLPFNFEVTAPKSIKIFNAEEVILVNEITYANDSVIIQMPVFDAYLKAKIEGDMLKGFYVKEDLNRVVDFEAEFGNSERFARSERVSKYTVEGNWETVFSPNSEEDKYIAKGIFKQDGNKVTGTFRTTTGDYRYLEGVINANKLSLSTFDGAHAFLFTATVTDSTMEGMFYSGAHWKEPFIAKRNDTFELPDANDLTYLKEGYEALEFSFSDASGAMVSLADEQFKDKVVVVQIMGSWCPNCLDESKFYSEYYKNNQDKDIAFVALAFEYAKTEEKAFNSIKRLQNDVGIEYPILLAQYGTSNKTKAQEKLPMLNHVLSYPTSIFIDKKGAVRKIHTGFNGPATGEKYIEFKTEFESFVNELLAEDIKIIL